MYGCESWTVKKAEHQRIDDDPFQCSYFEKYDQPKQHSKSRDVTLLTEVHLAKAMVFPVVMYGCESWTIKLSTKEVMLLNYGVGGDSCESLGLQGDQTTQS